MALAEVSAAASAFLESTSDYDQLLQTIARSGARALLGTCSVYLFDDARKTLTPVAAHDNDPEVMARFSELLKRARSAERPIVAALITNHVLFMPTLDPDAMRLELAEDGYELFSKLGVNGLIGVLLRVRGQLVGVLVVLRHRADVPVLDEVDREIAIHLATFAGLAIGNARLFRDAQSLEVLRRSEARAVQATMFLDAIIENIPDMVFVKDAERLQYLRLNRAGENLVGLPRDALIGKSDLDLFPREEAELLIAKDRETLRGTKLVDIPEEPVKTTRGERWLHTQKVPIVDATGEPRYLLGISQDITDNKRTMATLRAAKESAENANRELESFSYSVAHDLRSPLRSIDSFSRALIEDFGDKLGEVGLDYCVRVRNSAQRMAALIDDLLKLSRVTRSDLRRQPVDLGEMFRAALAPLQRETTRTVEIVASGELKASADAKLLAIVFDNLCGNAWKFTSKLGAARIELGTHMENGERVYFIRDNGVGFDMAYREKLFGVFQRLHPESEFPGTGVGLATVNRIIQRHGGRIWAEGEVGKGATFYFTLGASQPASQSRSDD